MAVAGLHNVSVLDSTFPREPQSEAARRRGDDGRAGTRASSLLQMWRELEDEHVVSHAQRSVGERLLQNRADALTTDFSREDVVDSLRNEHVDISEDGSIGENEFRQWPPGPTGSEIGSEIGQEDSSNLGEVERERVRQIFREWMSSSVRDRASSFSRRNSDSRAEWLGETEQERVRIIREWVQMNIRQRAASVERQDEQNADVVFPIGQVLDGSLVNHNEGRTERTSRGIRRLCGRQALLDMLKKAERERQRELADLSEHRAVSQFAHRNRIQSLLRGRFLRNDRIVRNERPTSMADSELGLLRQRQTVSDLREGFSSRLDHSVCGKGSSNVSDASSNVNGNRSEQTQTNNSHVLDEFYEQTESNFEVSDSHGLSDARTDVEGSVFEDRSLQGSAAHLEKIAVQVSENGVSSSQQPDVSEIIESRDSNEEDVNGNWQESTESLLSLRTVEFESNNQPSTSEIFSLQTEMNTLQSNHPAISDHVEAERNADQHENWHESAARVIQLQNQILESEERDIFGASLQSSEWRDGVQDNIDGHQHETIDNERMENENGEEASEVWQADGDSEEAVQSWFEEPSHQEPVPVGRMSLLHFPDDDNVYSGELRELLRRRSVSTLLHSSFRQSLDQLIQSYVERQSHAPLDWDFEEVSPSPAPAEQYLEQQHGDQNEGQEDAAQSLPTLPSSPMPTVQQLWDQESHNYSWPHHDMHQRFGIEWDIINDLRIDMATLQQRMNNMQRMLEACMDMQLELQRSIRQEVSAALNRSAGSSGICENTVVEDTSKWDYVRKGTCCICCNSNLDSLLYRCGHMCTCSKCANELVQRGEKCPMCRAPVIEVIRAYFIL